MKTISDLNTDKKCPANDKVKFIRYFHHVCLIDSDPEVILGKSFAEESWK